MFKLIKWTLIAGAATVGTGFLLFGGHTPSYLSTAYGSVRDTVRGEIPIEFEVKRAQDLIRAIDPEIEECKRDVARAEVELESLTAEIQRLDRAVAKGQRKIQNHRELLKDNQGNAFSISGITYSRREIMLDLERTLDIQKNHDALLRGKKSLLENQSRSVGSARLRLDAVRGEKAKLEDVVQSLIAQKRQVDALAASSRKFDFDTSNLARAKEVLAEVKKRLDVAQKMIQSDLLIQEGIPVDDSEPRRNILAEVDAYLDGGDEKTSPSPTSGSEVRNTTCPDDGARR
jgi:predicted  nucleic acid-binding Zn-ribbon protein